MNTRSEIKFLTMLRNKINLVIRKVSIKEPLLEVSAMLSARIDQLRAELTAGGD